jgi:hypothetical protein
MAELSSTNSQACHVPQPTTQQRQQLPAIYTLYQIEEAVASDGFAEELIEAIEDGFVALQKGDFFAAPIQTLGLPPFPFVENVEGYAAQACIKTGYFKGQYSTVIAVVVIVVGTDRELLLVLSLHTLTFEVDH